jgi:hypothetical protein
LQCVLAAKILTLDFVVCTLAVKKKIRAGFDMSDLTIPLSDLIRVYDMVIGDNPVCNLFIFEFKKKSGQVSTCRIWPFPCETQSETHSQYHCTRAQIKSSQADFCIFNYELPEAISCRQLNSGQILSTELKAKVKVKVKVTLRLAVYRQSVCLGVRPLETPDQRFSFPSWTLTRIFSDEKMRLLGLQSSYISHTWPVIETSCFCVAHKSSVSTGSTEQIKPILHILCYNGGLVTWMVASLTTAKFKPLIFSMSGVSLFILVILYDFCLFPAYFYCTIIV